MDKMNRNANPNPSDVELQGFNNVPLDHPNPLAIGAEVFRDKEGHRRRSWRTILGLAVLVGLLLIATTTFSVLYVAQTTKDPEVRTTTTTATSSATLVLTSLATTTTTLVSTHRRPKATETVTSVSVTVTTETTTASRTKFLVSLVTTTLVSTQPPTTVTTTSVTTETPRRKAAATTSVTTTVTTTATPPPAAAPATGRCVPPGAYGGGELHALGAGYYDAALAGAVEAAAAAGLDAPGLDPPPGGPGALAVGLGSVFRCAAEDALELVAACGPGGYARGAGGVACRGPAYTYSTTGDAATATTTTLPRVVPVPVTTVPSTTETTTEEVLVTITEDRFLQVVSRGE